MTHSNSKRLATVILGLGLAGSVLLAPATRILGSDHADSPTNANDQAVDQGDTYLFINPSDNTKLVVIETVRGFIVPSEAVNFGFFDQSVRHRFNFETTGDARPDVTIDVTFSPRTAANQPQMATVNLPNNQRFTAPTTVPTLAATPPDPVVTIDPTSGVGFFAGVSDDPFFFDITGFARFRASVLAGAADPTLLRRGRDSFAGYNILTIALSIPISLLGNISGGVVGVETRTQRQQVQLVDNGSVAGYGPFRTLDRSGNPALNALIIPFGRKDEYNAATTEEDAAGRFAADIVATLKALGTNDANVSTLASIYVNKGDFIRLTLASPAAFPNGRRLSDDVVDTFIRVATNGAITTGDSVDGNDVPFRTTFPFVAPPHQPFATGTVDDRTRN